MLCHSVIGSIFFLPLMVVRKIIVNLKLMTFRFNEKCDVFCFSLLKMNGYFSATCLASAFFLAFKNTVNDSTFPYYFHNYCWVLCVDIYMTILRIHLL